MSLCVKILSNVYIVSICIKRSIKPFDAVLSVFCLSKWNPGHAMVRFVTLLLYRLRKRESTFWCLSVSRLWAIFYVPLLAALYHLIFYLSLFDLLYIKICSNLNLYFCSKQIAKLFMFLCGNISLNPLCFSVNPPYIKIFQPTKLKSAVLNMHISLRWKIALYSMSFCPPSLYPKQLFCQRIVLCHTPTCQVQGMDCDLNVSLCQEIALYSILFCQPYISKHLVIYRMFLSVAPPSRSNLKASIQVAYFAALRISLYLLHSSICLLNQYPSSPNTSFFVTHLANRFKRCKQSCGCFAALRISLYILHLSVCLVYQNIKSLGPCFCLLRTQQIYSKICYWGGSCLSAPRLFNTLYSSFFHRRFLCHEPGNSTSKYGNKYAYVSLRWEYLSILYILLSVSDIKINHLQQHVFLLHIWKIYSKIPKI